MGDRWRRLLGTIVVGTASVVLLNLILKELIEIYK